MPKFKNPNATFWVIFKQCVVLMIKSYKLDFLNIFQIKINIVRIRERRRWCDNNAKCQKNPLQSHKACHYNLRQHQSLVFWSAPSRTVHGSWQNIRRHLSAQRKCSLPCWLSGFRKVVVVSLQIWVGPTFQRQKNSIWSPDQSQKNQGMQIEV